MKYSPIGDSASVTEINRSSIQYGVLKHFPPWDVFWSGELNIFKLTFSELFGKNI